MRLYDPVACVADPEISLIIPGEILQNLAFRSLENGNSIELEIATRLARSLERDSMMIEEDNELAYLAFQNKSKLL